MKNVVISGSGLFTPEETISNEELVASYNQYVDNFNTEHADAISAHIAIGFRAVDSAPPGSSSYPLVGRFWSTTRPE